MRIIFEMVVPNEKVEVMARYLDLGRVGNFWCSHSFLFGASIRIEMFTVNNLLPK